MTALSVEIKSYPRTAYVDQVTIVIRGAEGSGDLVTRCQTTLTGPESHYVDTYVQTALQAYLYGETFRGMARELAAVVKLARKHGETSEY